MKSKLLKKASLAAFTLVLAGGMATTVQAQNETCILLTTATLCPNQTIARVATNPYQMDPNNKVRKVLLYDIAPGHGAGKAAFRRAAIRMAERYGFELVISDAAIGYISATTLANVDVVLFSQGDKDVVAPQNGASENALADFIYRQGKSMLMIHASAAFITCPGTGNGGGGADITATGCHFMARAVARQYLDHVNPGSRLRIYADSTQPGTVPPYAVGGPVPGTSVLPHGRVNAETRNIFNNALEFNWKLPANSPTDPRTTVWDGWGDEHYSYYNNPGPRYIPASTRDFNGVSYTESRLNILLAIDEGAGATNGNINFSGTKMGDHPMSWVRHMGNGLAAYNNSPHDNQPMLARTGGGRDGTQDSVVTKVIWNTIRFLAHDYVGCMDPGFAEFNPSATVVSLSPGDSVYACKTPVALISRQGTKTLDGVTSTPQGIRIATPDAGIYRVLVTDIKGSQVYAKPSVGGAGRKVELSSLAKGSYIVNVTTPSSQKRTARVLVD